MDRASIGRRAQDVQAGLRDVIDARVSATVPVTRQIGMAAQLAVHIRGLDVIKQMMAFHHFCGNLGISGDALPSVLATLEQVGWLRVIPNVYAPIEIHVSVPVFQTLYDTLGGQWSDRRPGELEKATMAIVDRLSVAPAPLEVVLDELGITQEDAQIIFDIGDLGGYLRQYDSPRERIPIVYAPLFTDENPEAVLNLIAKHASAHAEINEVIRSVKTNPGISISTLSRASPLVLEMVNGNVLRAPAIDSSGGLQSFAFAPFKTDQPRAVLEKARIILSCVRYGQGFSTITTIDDPTMILRGLKDRKMIGKTPHSNIGTQYAAAANIGVGWIEAENGRFRFRLYETEDNFAAVDLAIEMCAGKSEDRSSFLLPSSEVMAQFSSSGHQGILLPEANRAKAREVIASRQLSANSKTAKQLGRALMDDLRGIKRVI